MGRIYFGWYVVAVSAVVYMLVLGGTFSSFGMFVLPVSAEFKLSRADTNTALILLNIGNLIWAPFVGRALDRFSAKRIMMASAAVFGLSLVALSLSRSIWLSALVLAVPLSIAFQGAGVITMSVFLARWFTARRGRAMALALLGMSLATMIVAPVIGMSIEAIGWRRTLTAAGVVIGGLIFILGATMRDRPGPDEAEAARGETPSAAPAGRPQTVGALLRMPIFWTIALAIAAAQGIAQALVVTLVPLGLQGGLSMLEATTLISAYGAAGIAGKLLLAAVADRLERMLLLAALIGLVVAVNAGLLASHSYAVLMLCAIGLGAAVGAIPPVQYALLADRFGAPSFGTVRGLMSPVSAVSGLICLRVAGEVFDRTGGYGPLFAGFVVSSATGVLLLLASRLLWPSPRPQAAPMGAAAAPSKPAG
jgi:MFS family permease